MDRVARCFNHVSKRRCAKWAEKPNWPKKMKYWMDRIKLINPLADKVPSLTFPAFELCSGARSDEAAQLLI